MNDLGIELDQLIRALLSPDSTRQLAKDCEQMRQSVLDQFRAAGCDEDSLLEINAFCLKHQRELNLILAAHAERLEAHKEYRPELFAVLRQQFGHGPALHA